ncbi:MAG: tyrosine-type recombinase/integrase [Bacteroidota bacterium]
MRAQNEQIPKWASASPDLYDAYLDFIMSRQAMMCREKTVAWYAFTLDRVLDWMVQHGVTHPAGITARDVRAYLANMAERGLSDSTMNNHARTIRTLLLFFYNEKYIPELVKFKMPSIAAKRLRFLDVPELEKVLRACTTKRDKVLILLMVDTGARRAEVEALNWGDVDIPSGLVKIVEGKGGKARSVVVGMETRRALLAYRRELENTEASKPLFQTSTGHRLEAMGIRSVLERVGDKAGVKMSPHALRRTFATMSLRAGMNPLHLQALLGHTTLEMTRRYTQMIDDDLVTAHKDHGPIDNLLHKKR